MSNGKILKVDQQIVDNYDDTEAKLFKLTLRQTAILLSQIEYFKWVTRWDNLSYTQAQLDEITGRIADNLMTEYNLEISCEDIEACIEASAYIINMQNDITSIQGDVSGAQSDISDMQNDISGIQDDVSDMQDSASYNVYPDPPVQGSEPDMYCGSAWVIAEYLNTFIQNVITDASAITFPEFIVGLLGLGGFKASPVKLLWDYIIVSSNPALSADVLGSVQEVAQAFYCNNLQVEGALQDILASSAMSAGAIACYERAINSLTLSKYSELVYIGSLDESRDCTSFCPNSTWCYTWDYSNFSEDWTIDYGVLDGVNGLKTQVYNFGYGTNVAQMTMQNALQNVTSIEFEGYRTGFKTQNTVDLYRASANPIGSDGATHRYSGHSSTPENLSALFSFTGTPTEFKVSVSTGSDSTPPLDTGGYDAWIQSITLRGTGINPFGEDNC